MRSFGKLLPPKRKVAPPPPPDTPAPAKPKVDFATRQRQLAEERRVLDQLRRGRLTYDEVHSHAALHRLVEAGLVACVGYQRSRSRSGVERALFGLTEKAEA